MKKDIEQQLRDKKDDLDLEQVPTEVWSNVQRGWNAREEKTISFSLWWKVAAVILLTTSIALFVRNHSLKNQIKELATLGDISPEYRDVENAYLTEINHLMSQMDMGNLQNNHDYGWMMDELRALEEINLEYRSDIGKSVNNDRLVDALIDYYEKKIRLLKKLELEINRQQNEEEHTSITRTI